MNYLAVAKVGILVFADHIHDTYIGESGWSGQTWDWLKSTIGWSTSATLVDVVNKIWNVVSNAVTIIKEAATNVLNAVKSGLEWISNSAIALIIDGIASGSNAIVKSLFTVLSTFFTDFSTDFTNTIPELVINGNTIKLGVDRQSTGLHFYIGDEIFDFSDILGDTPSFETLSVAEDNFKDAIMNLILFEGLTLLSTFAARLLLLVNSPQTKIAANALFFGTIIATFLSSINVIDNFVNDPTNEEFDDLLLETTSLFHLGSVFGILTQMLSQRVGSAAILAINALPLLILLALSFTPEHLINNPYLVLVYFAGYYLGKIKATILGPIEAVDIEKLQSQKTNKINTLYDSLYSDQFKLANQYKGTGELSFLFQVETKNKASLQDLNNQINNAEKTNARRQKVNFNSMIFLVTLMLYHLTNFVSYTSYRF